MTNAEIQKLIEQAEAELKLTTVGFVNKHWKVPPAGSKWALGLDKLADAYAALEPVVEPPPEPPPTPGLTVSQSIPNGATLTKPVAWEATPSADAKVDFYIDNVKKWTENLRPYFFNGDGKTLDPATLANGPHELKVIATPATGASAETSSDVTVNVSEPPPPTPPPAFVGVPFVPYHNSSTDPVMNDTTKQQWVKDHWDRSVTFLDRWPWYFPQAWHYIDAQAIYNPNHPSHAGAPAPDFSQVLKDSSTGKPLFVDWGCSGGICPQYAADPGNTNYRTSLVNRAKAHIATGNKGIFIDDVNLAFNFSDGTNRGRTPAGYTIDQYRNAFCEMLELVRQAIPGAEICHNPRWFDSPNHDAQAAWTQRQIRACDFVNSERGVIDPGIHGGTDQWSYNRYFTYIDNVHALGRPVVTMSWAETAANVEIALAGYWLTWKPGDMFSSGLNTPAEWQPLYDLDLGAPKGPRTYTSGTYRRDFEKGYAMLTDQKVGKVVKTL